MKYKKFNEKISYEIATPEIVANFIAKDIYERLRELGVTAINIIDCCCGIGNDTIALSKVCNFVLAVDISKERLKIAEKNAKIFGCKNIKFICEDIFNLSIKNLKEKYELNVAFADPQRRIIEKGKFKRTSDLAETLPNTIKLINFLQKEIPNICVLASSNAKVNLNLCYEKEYIGWTKRKGKKETILALYFGNLKKYDTSVVVLPSCDRIYGNESKIEKFLEKPLKYLYEIKDCVVKAGMQNKLAEIMQCEIYSEKFLTSEKILKSNFFENRFEILEICDKEKIIENLKKFNAGKVVIRGKINPEEHIKMKKEIENILAKFGGKEKLHVFLEEKILIGKCIDFLD